MSEAAARKILRWDVATAKRQLRDEADIAFLRCVLAVESAKKAARKGLVRWIKNRIDTLRIGGRP
ncbi:MAG TPA: hypothetical protein VIM61_00600 [Chthoniobacterales bacterium]|jgi:hypothetical protein